MAQLGVKFSPTEHSTEQQDFTNFPDGIYCLEMISSDVRKDGDDEAVTATFEVREPEEYAGRRMFGWYDINHHDPSFQERGNRDFSRLCRAIGYDEESEGVLEDSEALHYRPFMAKVKDSPAGVSKAGKPYKAKNTFALFYYPDEGNLPTPVVTGKPAAANDNKPAARAAAAAAPQQRAAGARPWGGKK